MQMIYMRIKCPFYLICHLTSLFKAYVDEMHSMFSDWGQNIVLTNPHLVDEFARSPLENGWETTKEKKKMTGDSSYKANENYSVCLTFTLSANSIWSILLLETMKF